MTNLLRRWFNDWNRRKCVCGCQETFEVVTDQLYGMVSESSIRCVQCKQEVNYWAYGHYQYPQTRTGIICYIWGHSMGVLSKLKMIWDEL